LNKGEETWAFQDAIYGGKHYLYDAFRDWNFDALGYWKDQIEGPNRLLQMLPEIKYSIQFFLSVPAGQNASEIANSYAAI